jgi:hypothetical protein
MATGNNNKLYVSDAKFQVNKGKHTLQRICAINFDQNQMKMIADAESAMLTAVLNLDALTKSLQ